jgi:hypothetical protein
MTDKPKKNTSIDRKEYLEYAFDSTTANRMTYDVFLDCAAFISKQINVNDLEEIRKTLDTNTLYKNNKDFKLTDKIKLTEKIKSYTKLLISLLFLGLFCFLVLSICYAFWFMKRDTVKSQMGIRLLLSIFGIMLLFLTFVLLYYMIMIQSKKIMLLL